MLVGSPAALMTAAEISRTAPPPVSVRRAGAWRHGAGV